MLIIFMFFSTFIFRNTWKWSAQCAWSFILLGQIPAHPPTSFVGHPAGIFPRIINDQACHADHFHVLPSTSIFGKAITHENDQHNVPDYFVFDHAFCWEEFRTSQLIIPTFAFRNIIFMFWESDDYVEEVKVFLIVWLWLDWISLTLIGLNYFELD